MLSREQKKGRQRRRRQNGPKFIQLFRYVLDSPAYTSLSLAARAALVEVIRGYNGQNNGQIVLSVRDLAHRMNCHRNTAARALRELVEKGFIEPRVKGAFSVKFRRATEWRLNDRRCDVTGTAQSQAFLKWTPARAPWTESEGKFKTRSQKLGPDGPKKQDTTEVRNPNPRSQISGHPGQNNGPKKQDTSRSTMHCLLQEMPSCCPDTMAPVPGCEAKPGVDARIRRPGRRATARGQCFGRTKPWKTVGMSRSGWYAAGKPMSVNDGAAKPPWSTPTLTEDRGPLSVRLLGLGVSGNEVEAGTAPDDGIPDFLRRTPRGAAA